MEKINNIHIQKKKRELLRFSSVLVVIIMSLLILIININLISAQGTSFGGAVPSGFYGGDYQVFGSAINPQFTQPSFYGGYGINVRDYWFDFNRSDCKQRQDVVLMIPPGGCSPVVVRSDLLEERNVPVFCKVASIQVNPLIDISKIRSISFKNKQAEGAQVSFFPARAAVRSSRTLEGSPIIDNVGYLVITLSRQEVEAKMPDWVEGNVTAVIDYDAEGVFGVGEHDFYLTEMDDDEWERSYKEYGFWKGKGFIRLDSVDVDSARVSIYRDGIKREATVNLKKGETSSDVYLEGYYCAAGMNIKLEDVDYPVDTALLKVDDEDIWVAKGSRFLDGKCRVSSLEIFDVGGGKVSVKCSGVGGAIELMLGGAEVSLKVNDTPKNYTAGDLVKVTVKSEKRLKEGAKPITSSYGSSGVIRYREEDYENIEIAKNIYVAYVGRSPEGKGNFVVLLRTSDDEGTFLGKRIGDGLGRATKRYEDDPEFVKTVKQIGAKGVFLGPLTNLANLFRGKEKEFFIYLQDTIWNQYHIPKEDIMILSEPKAVEWKDENIILESATLEGEILGDEVLKEYYDLAVENYNEVFELYPNERKINNQNLETYSERALYNAAELSRVLGLKANQIKYLEKLIENYPDSSLANKAGQDLEEAYKGTVSKDSQAVVYINNEPHFISLRDFKKPSYEDLGAELIFTIDGKQEDPVELEKGTQQFIPDTEIPIEILEINEDSIKIRYDPEFSKVGMVLNPFTKYFVGEKVKWETEILEIGKVTQLTPQNPQVSVKLVKTNLNKQAKVKIIPKTFGMRTESDLSFKIGIEKRAIKLSPEKTQEMIDNLDKSIKDWESVNDKLGKVVTGMKGACFATSAMLTVKNLFSGWNGESMARHEVMTASGGWNEKCRQWSGENAVRSSYTDKTYSNVQACLLDMDEKGYINSDIEAYKMQIETRNNIMEQIQKDVGVSDKGFLSESYDINEIEKAYRNSDDFKGIYNSNIDVQIKGENRTRKLQSIIPEAQLSNLNVEEMKDIVTYGNILSAGEKENSATYDVAEKKLGELLYNIDKRLSVTREVDGLRDAFKDSGITAVADSSKETKVQEMNSISGESVGLGDSTQAFLLNVPITEINSGIAGQKIKAGLKLVGGNYIINKAVNESGGDVTQQVQNYYNKIGGFTKASPDLYDNELKGDVKVKYYERAPYKGLPAQVPIGKVGQTDGWYVATDYVLSGFGKPYEESGRAINFWICNVGENGLIEFKQGDECRYYNLGTSQDLGFSGLSQSDSAKLVNEAQKAITEASRQYGKKEVVINRQTFKTDIAENGESGKCSDFMSPQDCHLMFNICDPVLCPESRCDYGGEYRVANVVQSGIIGSLLLCLPNAQEGIMIPVCLTGVHAGIEGYLSILKSTQACLQESLGTGRNIGICDEIKSVYLCEFFWRQAVPLMDVFIPRVFGAFFGQGVRGGGEYMTVDYAWENAKNSIDYFKNEYAVNAMKAFNDRSTSEVGGEVCKMFISARYPSSKDFFDNLVEPDSPVQYHAWFSENILTEATIPSTSHYKVYYHIYAGKDIGANYVVYLRNPPESAYVHTMATYIVDRGYIAKGGQIDQARDFTGISGYQELCVNVNGQEECGFKQVSTSWAIDELARRYAAEQAKEGDIITSKECVSGSPSLWSFAQPDLQAGAQEAVSPELYKRGIIRVCSSDNPGKSVDPSGELDKTNSTYDRWKRVGYCDTPEIGCWVDTNSVKDVLADAPNLTQQVLDDIDLSYLGEVEVMDFKEANNIISEADELVGKAKIDEGIIAKLKRLSEFGPSNPYKANAFFLIGQVYGEVVKKLNPNKKEISGGGGDGKNENVVPENKSDEGNGSIGKAFEWTNDMLREKVVIEVLYNDINKRMTRSYKYDSSKEGWVSTDDSFNDKLGYVNGTIEIIKKVDWVGDKIYIEGKTIDRSLGDSDKEMADKVFELLKK